MLKSSKIKIPVSIVSVTKEITIPKNKKVTLKGDIRKEFESHGILLKVEDEVKLFINERYLGTRRIQRDFRIAIGIAMTNPVRMKIVVENPRAK